MPVFTSSIELSDDYPSIQPSLNLNFAGSRALDPRITFTRASTATYVGRDGLIKTAGEDEARFDHDPLTLESLGLLIEESRVNYVNNSTSPSAWAAIASAVDETTYPIKGLATTRLTDSPSDGDSPFLGCSNFGTGSSIPMCMSIYVDAVNSTSDTITLYLFGGGYIAHNWTISTGVPVASENFSLNGSNYNSGSQEVIDCGGGIYRLILKANYTGSTTTTARFYLAPSGGATDYVIIAGPQIENGAFPTSYIPTAGSSVTRAADYATILGDSFDSFYNTQEWTVLCDFKLASLADKNGNCRVWDINNNTNNGRIGLLYDTGSFPSYFGLGADGAVQLSFSIPVTGSPNLDIKTALGWSPTSSAGYYEGTLIGTDNTSTTYAPTQFQLGDFYSDNRSMNGTISKLAYYGKRLTDAQLQLLTS